MTNGEWQTVVRRKKYPPNWRHAPNPASTVKPYIPYKPTYAQALGNPAPTSTENTNPKSLPPAKPQPNPIKPNQTTTKEYYTSSHAQLRFPPSPQFKEWRGCCFRCCRRGHTAVQCRNLKKCGLCWGDGHTGTHYPRSSSKPPVSPPLPPAKTNMPPPPPAKTNMPPLHKPDPSFDELLEGPYPHRPKPMPEGRPTKSYCYVQRDAHYYA